MKHLVKHDLDQQTARRVADHAWESYSQRFAKYHPRIEWVRDNHAQVGFTAKGIKLAGALSLDEGAIGLELEVPLLLRPFKNKAISVIDEEIRSWIAKAKSGQV